LNDKADLDRDRLGKQLKVSTSDHLVIDPGLVFLETNIYSKKWPYVLDGMVRSVSIKAELIMQEVLVLETSRRNIINILANPLNQSLGIFWCTVDAFKGLILSDLMPISKQ